jgi:stage V sporulation protein SpoVS
VVAHSFARSGAPRSAPPSTPDVAALLDAAEPIQDARALVIGPEALEVLCGLIGRGCAGATETSVAARTQADPAEILLMPHVATLNDAMQAIALARRALLPCGRIVLNDRTGALAGAVMGLLRSAGFSSVRAQQHETGTLITADWPMFGVRQEVRHA